MTDFINNQEVSNLLLHYGGPAIFILLAGGIIGWPIPDELILLLSGTLMKKGKINIPLSLFFAYLGSFFGISTSYLIGRLAGSYILKKKWALSYKKRIDNVRDWFEDFGKWTLFFGYYIPGIRHLTGFFAGMSKMNFWHFAAFAYSGAFVWVSTFLLIGYHLHNWHAILTNIALGTERGLILCLLIFMFFFWKMRNRKIT